MKLARHWQMTMVGYGRSGKMNLHSRPERVPARWSVLLNTGLGRSVASLDGADLTDVHVPAGGLATLGLSAVAAEKGHK